MTDYRQKNYNRHIPEPIQDEFSQVKNSVRHKQAHRKIRKKRKKINRLKEFFRFVTLLLLLFLGYQFFKLPQWYLPQDTFTKQNTERIQIVNNKIIPASEINKSFKDVKIPKLPIFLMKVKPIKKEIFKIPVIKNIYVRRYGFPARIQIIVRERTPIAFIKTDLKARPAAFFTSDGLFIMTKPYMNLVDNPDILKILTNGKDIQKNWATQNIKEIQNIVEAVENYSNEQVEYIDMRNPNDIYIKIKTTSIRLGLLDNTVYERIKRIYTILPQIQEVDSQIKYIDLSWDRVNYLKLNKSK